MILHDSHDPDDFSQWTRDGGPPPARWGSVLLFMVTALLVLAVFWDVLLVAVDQQMEWLGK